MAVLYGLVYTTGGSDSYNVLSSVERYDPASNSWVFVRSMTIVRMHHRVVELDGSLFAIGGHDGCHRLECYSPGLDQWSMLALMSIKRSVFGAKFLNGYIYSVGGYDGKKYLNNVKCMMLNY